MFVLKGVLLGSVFFVAFAVFWFRNFFHSLGIPMTQVAITPGALVAITVGKPLFWAGLFFCFGLGMTFTGFWQRATAVTQ
jgi:hypothetical protein